MDKFVNLHVHTAQGSLLDGLTKTNELFDKTMKLDQPAVAITDHGTLFAVVDAAKYAQKFDYNYIAGVELYTVPNALIKTNEKANENDVSRNHLVCWAKNNEGYKRLMKITSWGFSKGFYYRPRVDISVIKEIGTDGIMASSACFVPNGNLDVLTKDGIKQLIDIRPGDYVYTHHHEFRKVISPTTRFYQGRFYTIDVQGNLPLTVTENHRFYVYRDNQVQLLPISELTVNDKLLTAVDDRVDNIEKVDISECKGPLRKNSIELKNRFLKLLGLYMMKGSLTEEGICFQVRMELKLRVKTYIHQTFGMIYSSMEYDFDDDIVTIKFKSLVLKSLFTQWFHENKEKIPDFVKFACPEKQLAFINGMLLGNLSEESASIKDESGYSFDNLPVQAAYDILHILNRNFINTYVSILKNKYKITIDNSYWDMLADIVLYENPADFSSISNCVTWNDKKYMASSITNISSFEDSKQVYCLNVDVDHSFQICNILVENCIAGEIPQLILNDNIEEAKERAIMYHQLFKDGFFLEIQAIFGDGGKQVKINKGLIDISKETGIPLVACCDSHYLNQEDASAHDILLCTQSKTTMDDPNRWRFCCDIFYIMSREEILGYFKKNGHEVLDQKIVEEAVDNTVYIASQCKTTFTFGKHYLPKIEPPTEEENPVLMKQFNNFEKRRILEVAKREHTNYEEAKARLDPSSEYLRFLCIHGWHGMFQQMHLDPKYLSLMFYELDVIISMGFPSYFLIMYDIMEFCHEKGIARGTARGCGTANNLVNIASGKNTYMVPLNEVKEGDIVTAKDEKHHRVLKVYQYDVDEDIIKLGTEDGHMLNGFTKDHFVLAVKKEEYDKGNYEPSWFAIDDLCPDDYLCRID